MTRSKALAILVLAWLLGGPTGLHMAFARRFKAMLFRFVLLMSGLGLTLVGSAFSYDQALLILQGGGEGISFGEQIKAGWLVFAGIGVAGVAGVFWLLDLIRLPRLAGSIALRRPQDAEDVEIEDDAETKPIRVVVGFLEGVSEKDVRAYARGFIERHFSAQNESFWYVCKHRGGWLYEVHEGGCGLAYLPSLLPKLEPDHPVYLNVSNRTLKIEYRDEQIISLLLPEDTRVPETEGVVARGKMHPLIGYRTEWFVTGASVFGLGLVVLIASAFIRYQTLLPEIGSIDGIYTQYQKLPIGEWKNLGAIPEGRYVSAMRYDKGRWRFQVEEVKDDVIETQKERKEAVNGQ